MDFSDMRSKHYIIIIIAFITGYVSHLIFGSQDAIESPRAVRDQTDFPIDSKQINRSNPNRVSSYADVLDPVTPAVVSVYPSRIVRINQNQSANPWEDILRRFYGLQIPQRKDNNSIREEKIPYGLGSGVIVSKDGYILTNNHVITDERGNRADEIEVKLNDGRTLPAKIIGNDPRTDIAVLKIDAKDLPIISMASSSNLKVGDVVFAIGNPLGVGTTVTMGIISATQRTGLNIIGSHTGNRGYENFIQTDASINPGNSGGALVDADGRIIGINTAIYSRTGGSIGIGFAIPIDLAQKIMLSLINTGEVVRGFLGVRISNLTPDLAEASGIDSSNGAIIIQIEHDTPAQKAGLKRGDIITSINNYKIKNSAQLRLIISQITPGEIINVQLIRNRKIKNFDIKLGSLGSSSQKSKSHSDTPLIGIGLVPLDNKLKQELNIEDGINGLIVKNIENDSPYAKAFRENMVILEANDKPTTNIKSLKNALRKGANRLYVYDSGTYGYIAIRIK